MAQNVTIAGASYTDVTAIEVPKTTSGVASFHDVTDTTATASDVLSGKSFYNASGVKTSGSIATKAAATYTPGTTNQTIAAGQYLTGAQTITGDANLVPANIAQGVTIFGVQGTHAGGGGAEDEIIARTISGTYSNSRISSIGPYAFAECQALLTVSVPACETIGQMAFSNCTSLEAISAENCHIIEQGAFKGCRSLVSASFPLCTSIGNQAFSAVSSSSYYRTSLTSAYFPQCTTIESEAFEFNFNLSNIYFPECTIIGNYAFHVRSNYAMERQTLTSASFPKCISIGAYAFQGQTKLNSIYFPSCEYIGNGAFQYCDSLISASFPECTTLGQSAFFSCISLSTVYLPSCLRIPGSAFYYCTNLTDITLTNCSSIAASRAFGSCSKLTTINLPECTYVGSYAFESCISLATVSIPKCNSIMDRAFYHCHELRSITLNSCSALLSSTFAYCSKLESVYLLSTSVMTLQNYSVFVGTPISNSTYLGHFGSIYVPASLVDAYKSKTNWTMYSSRIVGYVEPDPVIIFPSDSEYALNPDDLADWMDAGKTIKFYLGSQDPGYGTPDANIDGYSFVFDYTGLGITSSEVRTGAMYQEYDIIDVPSIGDMTGYVYSELNNGILRVGATMYLV